VEIISSLLLPLLERKFLKFRVHKIHLPFLLIRLILRQKLVWSNGGMIADKGKNYVLGENLFQLLLFP
jgi:hypothetical protein